MRRVRAALAAVVVGTSLGVLVAAGGGGGGDGYLVRAVFDNASFVIPGEDVKVAGVRVGTIEGVDLTRRNKAVLVLRIEDPAFVPFRKDAHCQIRLQSLIGEQFVECEPTMPQRGGERPAPPLEEIESGPGEGQHLLPVESTTTPVPIDLINNITRLPQRQRLRLIIGELGAGLAGNGDRLRAALRRANPALRELQEVIHILAEQERLLARLIDESDRVLRAWAARREQFAGFIDHAGATAAAAAERGADIERNFQRLPPFLRELRPTADRFSAMAAQMIPALRTLQREAPAVNAAVARLGPFVSAATPALESFGDFADRGRTVLPALLPLVRDLRELGRPLRPAAGDLAALSESFDRSGGIEELMRFIFFYTNAVNGVDELGHYVRTGTNIGSCSVRSGTPVPGCPATFDRFAGSSAASARAPRRVTDSESAEALLDYFLGPEGGS